MPADTRTADRLEIAELFARLALLLDERRFDEAHTAVRTPAGRRFDETRTTLAWTTKR